MSGERGPPPQSASVRGADRPTRFGAKVAISDGVSRALAATANAAVPLEPQVAVANVRRFVKTLDARISYPAQDAELSGPFEAAGIEIMSERTHPPHSRAMISALSVASGKRSWSARSRRSRWFSTAVSET